MGGYTCVCKIFYNYKWVGIRVFTKYSTIITIETSTQLVDAYYACLTDQTNGGIRVCN